MLMFVSLLTAALVYTHLSMSSAGILMQLITFGLTRQAGMFISILATLCSLGGEASVQISPAAVVPLVGLLSRPKIKANEQHTGGRLILDEQIGFIAQGIFYVLLGARNFGWSSVWGWPIAILMLLLSVLARPWLALFGHT